MNSPGAKTLWGPNGGDFTLTTAGTYIGEWLTDLDGMIGASVQLSFAYGSAGTAVRAYIQTAIDGSGTTPIDIACVVFGTSGEVAAMNFDGTAGVNSSAPTNGTMTDDTKANGPLGTMLRVKVVVTGTYVSTFLAVRMVAR